MPLPKRRFSHTRTKIRRGGQKKNIVKNLSCLVRDDVTKIFHMPHRAYKDGNAVYYRGKIIYEGCKKNIG